MNRITLTNWMIDRLGYTDYLQVGGTDAEMMRHVRCANKTLIDPVSPADYQRVLYRPDVVYVDKDRRSELLLKDVLRSLDLLKPNGSVILRYALPYNKRQTQPIWAMRKSRDVEYYGDAWRVIASLSRLPSLDVAVGAFDTGIAVIMKRLNSYRGPFPRDPVSINRWTWEQYKAVPLFRQLREQEITRWMQGYEYEHDKN